MRVVMMLAIVLLVSARIVYANDTAHAVVTWPNGDRLSGQLISNSNGVITLSTQTVGEVTVKSTGVTLTVVDAPDLGKEDESSAPEPEPATAATAATTAAAAQDAATELAKEEASSWKGSLSLAASTSRAANDTAEIRLGGTLRRKDDAGKFDLAGAWYWNNVNGKTTDNDLLVRGSQEWFVKETKWLYFVQATWQYDQFENWGHRLSPYAGIGYKLYAQDDLNVTLKGGGGLTWQYQDGTTTPQVLFEINTEWKINDRQSLAGLVSIAPSPIDWSSYLATAQADWKLKLGSDTPWSITLGVRSIYDSRPTGGADANDFKAYAGLTMDF
jgi:putative salt-induced outer membrane protein YdiY